MGGSVAFAIKHQGAIQTRVLYKSAAEALCDPAFFEQKDKYFHDWNEEPAIACAPLGYGLVFVDFDNKLAISMQNYCNVDVRMVRGLNESILSEDEWAALRTLWGQGRLRGVVNCPSSKPKKREDFEGWAQRVQEDLPGAFLNLDIAPPKGWDFCDIRNLGNNGTWHHFAQKLVQAGVSLGSEDWERWNDYVQDYEGNVESFSTYAQSQVLQVATPPAKALKKSRRM